jgi:hypothetical protein
MATQVERILKHLKSGKSITARQARDLYGVDRLAARIHDLRDLPWKPSKGHYNIRTDMITVNTRHGKARIAKYSLVR